MDVSFPRAYGHLHVDGGDQRLCGAVFRVRRPDGVRQPHKILAAVTTESKQRTGGLGRRRRRSFRDLQEKNGNSPLFS